MTAMTFSIHSLLTWNGNKITDHNRQELSVDVTRIETATRMADGRMRKYWIADKRSFSLSWKDLPSVGAQTVDGFWSSNEMENFYNTNTGSFTITITDGTNAAQTFTVVASSFQKTVKKRASQYDLVDLSVKLDEV